MGTLLGGSQGLARSMFGQMVQDQRCEFFASSAFGKVAHCQSFAMRTMTVMFDSSGNTFHRDAHPNWHTVMMRWVDVEEGRKDAMEEDAQQMQELTHKRFNGFRFALGIEQSLE